MSDCKILDLALKRLLLPYPNARLLPLSIFRKRFLRKAQGPDCLPYESHQAATSSREYGLRSRDAPVPCRVRSIRLAALDVEQLLYSVLSHRQVPGPSNEDQSKGGGRKGRRQYDGYRYPYYYDHHQY
jgi:hypothetical protein